MLTMQRGTLMSFSLRPMLVALVVTTVAASTCPAECSSSAADEPIVIVAPVPHQVVQRQMASSKEAGADQRGFANVRVQLKVSAEQDPASLECRVLTLLVASEANQKTSWQPLKFKASNDQNAASNAAPNEGMNATELSCMTAISDASAARGEPARDLDRSARLVAHGAPRAEVRDDRVVSERDSVGAALAEVPWRRLGRHRGGAQAMAANASRKAAIVASMSASLWAREVKPASKALGAR